MPGLGDTGIGDEERVIKTLGADIDIVLFVRMPKSMGDFWSPEDINLYEIAKKSLTDLPIEEWSCMVLNHIEGKNYKQCNSLKNDIENKHLLVQDVIIADCSKSDEAQEKILDRVLNYLTQKIDVLDNKYSSACQTRLIELQKLISVEIEKAQTVLCNTATNIDWDNEFEDLCDNFLNDLTNGLEKFLSSLIVQRDTEDINLKTAVNTTIQHCRSNADIPTLKQISDERDRYGSVEKAYAISLHKVRTNLSQKFLDLGNALTDSIEKAKSQVVEILVTSGKLGRIKADEKAIDNSEKELNTLLIEPSQACFAIVEEFVDQVLRAKGAEKEWRKFLRQFANDVWSEEFGAAQANSELKKEWVDVVDKVKQANKLESLTFSKYNIILGKKFYPI